MKAKQFFQGLNDYDLQFWWFQYGQPRQAAHYRGVPRRAAKNEMDRRNLAPLELGRTPRPRGYEGEADSFKGYLINWGIR